MFHTIRWTSEKIRQRINLIATLVYQRREPLAPFRYLRLEGPLADPPVYPEAEDEDWQPIPWQTHWGEPNADFVLRTRFRVPAEWDTDSPIALYLPIGTAGDFSHPEALAYIDGQPHASCDRHHQEILLSPHWCDGNLHTLALHGWTGGTHRLQFDAFDGSQDEFKNQLFMGPCHTVQIHQPTRDFISLARVALGVADTLDIDEPARAHLYNALDEAFKVLDTREPFGDHFYASVPAAYETLREGIARSGPPLDVDITAVGHAHIDVAWLWPLAQTRRKASRTFYNALRLMDQFPEFHFTQSQPQLYDYVRQDYPQLFELIRQRVQEGRWEPIGGMWVEADCNLSGGEALARQFLLGLTFFQHHFGERGKTLVLWLPDVFGYAWNLPQLIKEAGLEYFFTIKIGWSQYNRLPYDSFWWQGLDGTRVLTHFSPTRGRSDSFVSTYNALASPEQVLGTWSNFQQKDWGKPGVIPPVLMSYGYGDGGGGPTREMVENIREMHSFPATPRVQGGTVAEFFRQLEITVGDRLPTWNGELYLEYHRGTYTTQARNKRANRKSEFLLHDAEFLAAMASTLDTAYAYPHKELHRAWKLVCLNQFHDIIPGSSIGQVYADSLEQYVVVETIGDRIQNDALQVIGERTSGDLLLVNPTSFARSDLAFWPHGDLGTHTLERADGSPIQTQAVEGGLLLDIGDSPPYSITPLLLSESSPIPNPNVPIPDIQYPVPTLTATSTLLENSFLRVELNSAGDITRIYDKASHREVLPPDTTANQFQAFEDRPKTPDAWEIDIYYDDRMWLAEPAETVEVLETGPLRAALQMRRRIFGSVVTQRISLAHNSSRLDFDTSVQWHERHVMLKVAFPVEVLSPQASYEIQWGNVQRATHRNTSWDWARFETCAHKWVDLSEGSYGVSLLNDCKYGHDIHDNVIRLTLLRSPTDPDPKADLGDHQFTYSLLPHAGPWDERTVVEAYALNDPLIVWSNSTEHKSPAEPSAITPQSAASSSFVKADRPNVVIETIKQAEDGRGVIVRLYESQRQRGECHLETSFALAGAWRTNLLEEDGEPLEIEGHTLRIWIRPYQIVTLRLLPRPTGVGPPNSLAEVDRSPSALG
jgi:alpha-mannosidase